MEKTIPDQHIGRKRRNTTLCKTVKKDELIELDDLPVIPIQQAKTVKSFNRKMNKFPFLNIANLRGIQRRKFLSTDHRSPRKLHTQKDQIHGIENKGSCFLQETQLKFSQQTLNQKCMGQIQTPRKACIFPPIEEQKLTKYGNFQKQIQNLDNLIQTRRKKSRQHIHCKVLLAKSNHFPFIGNHACEVKKTDSLSSKQTHNSEHGDESQFFDLDISRINEVEEPPSPAFISKESFQEIAIF